MHPLTQLLNKASFASAVERTAALIYVEDLLNALKPLAELDLRPDGFDKLPDEQIVYMRDKTAITVGDVRRARRALRL